MKALSWVIKGFTYNSSVIFTTPSHRNADAYVEFGLSNSALPFVPSCWAGSTQMMDFFYGNQWFNCLLPPTDSASAAGSEAVFQFDKSSGRVDVKQKWVCPDVQDINTSYWSASGTVNVTMDCQRSQSQNANWTMGQIYSTDFVKCVVPDTTVLPYEIAAYAR